jgi:hypothetical protein
VPNQDSNLTMSDPSWSAPAGANGTSHSGQSGRAGNGL